MQLQNTIGKPLLPPFESLEWFYSDKLNKNNTNTPNNIFKKINFIKNNTINENIIIYNRNSYPIITRNVNFNTNFIDKEINKTIYLSTKKNINYLIEKNYNLSIINLNTKNNFSIEELLPVNENVLNENKSNFLNIPLVNLYPIYEIKMYQELLNTPIIKNNQATSSSARSLIFALSNFIGSSQYGGKWLGKVHFSFEGMKMSLLHTMKFNMYGNPHVAHEACSNLHNIENKIDASRIPSEEYTLNEELCLRWIQMVSLFPHARIGDILNNSKTSSEFNKILIESIKLRYQFSLYLYSYFLKMSLEGGSLIRPLFLDFSSKSYFSDLLQLETQFMVGSNVMVNPAFEYGSYNNQTYIKSTFFTSEKFYDYYSGEFINVNGAGFYNITLPIDKLSMYLKGGLITPIQHIERDVNIISNGISSMKYLPIQLIISLDSNSRSTGRILIDDGITNDSIQKKMYYKMEITASYSNNNFIIFFHVNSFKYKLPPNEYSSINQITIYGYTRISVRKITIINRVSRIEVTRENFHFDDTRDILKIKNLKISMDVDSKIIIL